MIFIKLFWVFLKIGTFGFGGGYAMLSLIQEEVVDNNQWISASEFTDLVAVSQMTPGPIGINSATYVGYSALHNQGYNDFSSIVGAIIATFALCLPSFLMICLISYFYLKFKSNRFFTYALAAIKPISVSLIALAALSLADQENFIDYYSYFLFVATVIATLKFKVHPIIVLFIAAILGVFIY